MGEAAGIFREGEICLPDHWVASENDVSKNSLVSVETTTLPNSKKRVTILKEYWSKKEPNEAEDADHAVYQAEYILEELEN